MQHYTARLLVGILVLITSCTTKAPQITRFDAPKSIIRGDKAVLVWDVIPTKALKNITLDNTQDSLPIQGKAEVQPRKAQEYELKIQYKMKGRMHSESRKIAVAVEEPVVKFTGIAKVDIGEEVILKWELPHFVQKVRLSEWVDGEMIEDWTDMPSHATYGVKPIKDALYKIEYIDEGILKVLEHKIEVGDAFFTGTRRIIAGEEVQLIWKVNPNIKNITLEKRENIYTRKIIKDFLPATGNFKTAPTQTTEYLLSLIDVHHTTLLHKVEVVQGLLSGQRIVKQGEKVYLSWRANPAAKNIWIETIENDYPTTIYANLSEEGQIEVTPKGNVTRFSLAVETAQGIERCEHTVRITEQNQANIYTQASPNAHTRYDEVKDAQHHHVGFSSLDDSPVNIHPEKFLNAPTKFLFDFDKSDLSPAYKAVLDALVQQMKLHESAIAEITGHADLKGTTKGCDRVAKARAESVKQYLIQSGIPEYRIITKSFGRMFPLNYHEINDTVAKENRRAEIVIMN